MNHDTELVGPAVAAGKPGTLDLILYRLTKIEQQTVGLVRTDTYALESGQLKARLTALEAERLRSQAQTRTLWAGVFLALLIPVLGNLPELAAIIGS